MPKLLLIRGLPGSGKSTLARSFGERGYFHVEADQWFMRDTEAGQIYAFDPKEVGKAHDWCQRQAALALERGSDVVVANTFSRRWEIAPYAKMARVLGAEFQVVTAAGNFKNVHNVPDDVIERMKARWEEWV